MINLRFHIVSLVAVFLALAIGVAIGATVVDQGLLSQSQKRIEAFDATLKERATTIDGLEAEVEGWQRLGGQLEGRAIRGRLTDVPVVVLAVRGVAEQPLHEFRDRLVQAGASVQGDLWVTSKVAMASDADLADARKVLSSPEGQRDALQFAMRQRLFDAITIPATSLPLDDLIDAGFLDFRARSGQPKKLQTFAPGTRVVVVSTAYATVPDQAFALPLLRLLSNVSPSVVIAGEVGSMIDGVRAPGRFVSDVLADDALAAKVTTIDDIDQLSGRLAAVFALEELPSSAVGHYGTGKGADRLLPAA